MKAKNTEVKIEAHGHLGDFSRTYFIAVGEEEYMFRSITKDFARYIRRGIHCRYNKAWSVMEELQKIEEMEAEK